MLNDKQQAQFNAVCARIADGKSLRDACDNDDVPHRETIRAWLAEDAGGVLSAQYARARDEQADLYADEILEIADDARNDFMEREGEDDKGFQVNGEHIQRSKLRVDARKWIASKLKPRVYGDKLAVGGAEDLPAIRQEVQESADAFTTGIAGMVTRDKAGKGETKH